MSALNGLLLIAYGNLRSFLYSLLSFDGKIVKVHVSLRSKGLPVVPGLKKSQQDVIQVDILSSLLTG